ncbi:aminoacetone oxidase family FAD-binding enzyme [uncultured Sulfitobacter sp.]|uniref:NAD(P)/FAD-dependent oxidoreductase n=1 Tax=uncultured Sulfitobacter sp. TaxID=191468 RepID=UPI00261F3A5F|nr:aminoacetone oxidase family FAD-binding enzyme [uncultured Sulfitobacter sp.]
MEYDTAIIGAGAAGMMCAAHLSGRTLLVDHAKAAGEKIRISGGGRCNFTNLYTDPDAFICTNPHFHKSALARYTQWDFIELVDAHKIAWHEKTLGQLFCDNSAKDIIAMLHSLMAARGVELRLKSSISDLAQDDAGYSFTLETPDGAHQMRAKRLVIATGGKSIPKMGASGFAYDIAAQFGLRVTNTRPALVPFTFPDGRFAEISGVATPARVHADGPVFEEALLFTHRGLSGPAVLQASSYWTEGAPVYLNIAPDGMYEALRTQRQAAGRRNFTTELSRHLPARLVDHLAGLFDLGGNLADWSDKRLGALVDGLRQWELTPGGTEGYRTAEVTLGGINTDDLDARSMAAKAHPSLYFIGEAVDVTGWLGGYNFQWAWSSGMAAAEDLNAG